MIPKVIYPCVFGGDNLWFEREHWFTQDGKYISEEEVIKIIAEKNAEINALVLENDLLKQSQIPKQIKDFVDEAMYVLSLRKNKRFTNSELSKDKLFEMFEDILHKA